MRSLVDGFKKGSEVMFFNTSNVYEDYMELRKTNYIRLLFIGNQIYF